MSSRERTTHARHVSLLSSDAPVMNRCAKEEAHLKHRLAQSTAAYTLMTQQSHAASTREELAREARLQAQFTAMLSATPELVAPVLATSSTTADLVDSVGRRGHHTAAAAAATATGRSKSVAGSVGASIAVGTPVTAPPCALGFPEAYESSGFKSTIHWATVAFDETFLTAYGPRRVREDAHAHTVASARGSREARDAQPHRLMAAVACYLLNEVLCADAAVAKLWRDKLRQPIFDAVFSSQSIAAGQEQSRALRGGGGGNGNGSGSGATDAAVADAIVHKTLGPDVDVTAPLPPRTNKYDTRNDFAALRLWTEEVAVERREKASVCHRVRGLQHAMARRQMAVHLFQRRAHQAELRAVFTVWRTHVEQRRANRDAMERYLSNKHRRYVEETIFLRWRRFTLRTKVEALQRRVLNIAADRDRAAREHTAALHELQEQLAGERRQHVQETFERDTLHAQVLDSHGVEVDALRLMLQMERLQTTESKKWARRWERAAKTFRPARSCPAVPRQLWTLARALLSSEEAFAGVVVRHGGDQHVLLQMPYSMILPARQRMEQLLLVWVNSIMQASPQASTWVPVDSFTQGHSSHPRGILTSQKQPPPPKKSTAAPRTRVSTSAPTAAAAAESPRCEFSVYALMCLVRELHRRYTLAGLMERAADRGSPLRGASDGARNAVVSCFHELTRLFSAQSCGGLYPPLLSHCASLSLWFTPDGVFGGPMSNLEGTTRQKRQQHTAFLWLLTSLLVGHIQLYWMAAPPQRSASSSSAPALLPMDAASLPCRLEGDMMRLAQLSFPVRQPAPVAGTVAAGTTKPPHPAPSKARGATVVAPHTLLTKKRSFARSSQGAARASSAASAVAAEEADGAAAATTEMTLEAMLRARQKATRGSTTSSVGSSMLVGKELLATAEDSLSDIEAFLGMAPAQVQSLKARVAVNSGDGDDDDDDDEDRWINGLLHQLFEAEDAEAQLRRTLRLQGGGTVVASGGGGDDDTAATTARSTTAALTLGAGDDLGGDDGSVDDWGDDAVAAAVENAKTLYGDLSKSTVVLTAEQLRLLRCMPGRSYAFDSLRPILALPGEAVPPSAPQGLLTDLPSTTDDAPVAPLYSFLLNTLDDAVARQQWRGLVRVITSLVVRFHVLDDSEDAVRRAAALAAATAREEEEEQRSARGSRPTSARRAGTPPLASTARLPPVSTALSGPLSSTVAGLASTTGGGGGGGGGGRVAARLVPSSFSSASSSPPALPRTRSSPLVNVDETAAVPLPPPSPPPWTATASAAHRASLQQTHDMRGTTRAPAAAAATPITTIVLGEELRSRVSHPTTSALAPLPSQTDATSLRGSAASAPTGPLSPSGTVHTPHIPTAALLPAADDGHGAPDYATASAEHTMEVVAGVSGATHLAAHADGIADEGVAQPASDGGGDSRVGDSRADGGGGSAGDVGASMLGVVPAITSEQRRGVPRMASLVLRETPPAAMGHSDSTASESCSSATACPSSLSPSSPTVSSYHASMGSGHASTSSSRVGRSTAALAPFTEIASLRANDAIAGLPAASPPSTARSSLPSASSSFRRNESVSAASGGYFIPQQNAMLHTPPPHTLPPRIPAPPPPPPSSSVQAPVLDLTAPQPAETTNSLSPLVVHADQPHPSPGQAGRKFRFNVNP